MKTLLLGTALLAVVLVACGGGSATFQKPSETTLPTPPSEEAPDPSIAFLDRLREENAAHYTLGCLYSEDFTAGGYTVAEILEGLLVDADARWAVGSVGNIGYGDQDAFIITLYDPADIMPAGAQDFEPFTSPDRTCFLPRDARYGW